VQIVVQVVDGSTGDPVRDRHLTVYAGDSPDAAVQGKMHLQAFTNKDGRALLKAPAGARWIQVWPDENVWALCQAEAKTKSFSVDTILSTGLQAPNMCGSLARKVGPGELVIYARRPTLSEKLKQ
jgi:hypothetical protein